MYLKIDIFIYVGVLFVKIYNRFMLKFTDKRKKSNGYHRRNSRVFFLLHSFGISVTDEIPRVPTIIEYIYHFVHYSGCFPDTVVNMTSLGAMPFKMQFPSAGLCQEYCLKLNSILFAVKV